MIKHCLEIMVAILTSENPVAASLMSRKNMTKRKGTQAARRVPTDFDSVKKAFLSRVSETVSETGNPSSQLTINLIKLGIKSSLPHSE